MGRRLRDLRHEFGKGLVLLASIPGDRSIETELHERFHAARHARRGAHGNEWFEPAEELLAFIKSLGGSPVGPVAIERASRPAAVALSATTVPAGKLLDGLAATRGIHVDALRDEINEALAAAGVDCVSRVTFWRWRNSERSPDIDQALVMEGLLGLSVRAWSRVSRLQPSARES
jgi:hypothetical protein